MECIRGMCRGRVHVGNQMGHIRGTDFSEVDLVAYPFRCALHSVTGVEVIWRVDANRRRWKVSGRSPTHHAMVDPKLPYPAFAQSFDRRNAAPPFDAARICASETDIL